MATLCSPMAGKVLDVLCKEGDAVTDGAEVVMLESMKMEVPVIAEGNGRVTQILVKKDDTVDAGTPLVVFE